ncbi:MAG: DUF4214 domain-containing protein [Saccharofermentans sp.]|nr:DUF4214 domain-containing protein [Saccharofermentans sp.]
MRKMLKRIISTILAAVIAISFLQIVPRESVLAYSANATIVNCLSSVNVREYPTNQSATIGTAKLASRIFVEGQTAPNATDTSGFSTWYKIQFTDSGVIKSGYIAAYYVNCDPKPTQVYDGAFEGAIAGFPESYKQYLRELHRLHPAWQFVPVYTGIDWNRAISIETRPGASLISGNSDGSWKSKASFAYNPTTGQYTVVDAGNWVNASEDIVRFYMDPRNNLSEIGIFQFVDLNYVADNSIPASAIQGILNTTFMAGAAADQNGAVRNFSDIFTDAGNIFDVNPIFLASHSIQECGKNGGTSSNGTNGVYNFYNIGAYSNVTNASVVGLNFAANGTSDPNFNATYMIPWNTPGRSIVGGARWIHDNYTGVGQGTLYFMRFNFDPSSPRDKGYHQYMTATASLVTESSRMQTAYVRAGMIDSAISFRIPVFDNMPGSASPLPVCENSTSSFVRQLYRTYLGREADTAGLNDWVNRITNGLSGPQVTAMFFNSQEYIGMATSNEAFLTKLYESCLRRSPDESGFNYWMNQLNSGASRDFVLSGFVNSDEYRGYCESMGVSTARYNPSGSGATSTPSQPAASTSTSSGRTLTPNAEKIRAFITFLYSSTLDRNPDNTGFDYWYNKITREGMSGEDVAWGFVFSNEMANKNLNNEQFVRVLYRAFLGREADPTGLQYWLNKLASGSSRRDVYYGFSRSSEFINRCVDAGFRPYNGY